MIALCINRALGRTPGGIGFSRQPSRFVALLGMSLMTVLLRSEPAFHSPVDVAFFSDGRHYALVDRTAKQLHFGESRSGLDGSPLSLPGHPTALVRHPWIDSIVYVSMDHPDQVVEVDTAARRLVRKWALEGHPSGLALSPRYNRLLVTLAESHEVACIDLAHSQTRARIPVRREPRWIAITPDQSTALIANFLPAESLLDPKIAASISFLNLAKESVGATVRLPTGSTLVRQIVVAPQGRWAYVVHVLARFAVPASQLDRAWISSNALTILDLAEPRVHATVLLDQFMNGAAEPWGMALSDDGSVAWVSLSGTHQIARIDLARIHALLEGRSPPPRGSAARPTIWQELAGNPDARERLADDLDALTQAGALERWNISARGPRGIAYSATANLLAVTSYFTGELLFVDPKSGRVRLTTKLGLQPEPDPVRLGEAIFHDATYSMQHWLSCSTCHPHGRVDGLNWDLMNDGIANPKNTKSLVWAYQTPPSMARGVRSSMEVAALAGFRYTQNVEPRPEDVEAVYAYLRSLEPQPPPAHSTSAARSDVIALGRQIFHREEIGCAICHPPPLFTDLKQHDVGTGRGSELGSTFDTPTLAESWRTAPYLHHGLANSLEDVFSRFNADDRHGVTSRLSAEERQALIQYLSTL